MEKAIQQFTHALQINPHDPSSYNNLGITLITQGKKDEGIQNLQQALCLARGQGNLALANSILKRLDSINEGQN